MDTFLALVPFGSGNYKRPASRLLSTLAALFLFYCQFNASASVPSIPSSRLPACRVCRPDHLKTRLLRTCCKTNPEVQSALAHVFCLRCSWLGVIRTSDSEAVIWSPNKSPDRGASFQASVASRLRSRLGRFLILTAQAASVIIGVLGFRRLRATPPSQRALPLALSVPLWLLLSSLLPLSAVLLLLSI